MSQQLQSV